jgi:hypothetical protein
MPGWIFSEDSWTSARNWTKRTLLWAAFAATVSAACAGGLSLLDYGLFWKPLQKAYFRSYLWAASPTLLGGRSDYSLLVLQVPGGNSASEYLATDGDVVPLDIESGRFRLSAEARRRGATGVRWATYSNIPDTAAYWELRDNIYNDRSAWDLWKWPRAAGYLVFLGLMVLGVYLDRKDLAGKREGKNVKGPVLVTSEQFNLAKQGDGIGIQTGPEATRLRVRAKDEWLHFSIMGDTGSGKSVLIAQILEQVRERDEPAIIYDPAMEFIPRYYRNGHDLILNPLDARSPFWSPSDELTNPHDALAVAESLFPDKEREQRFFTEGPRKIFAELLQFRPTPGQLVHWMSHPEEIDRRLAGTPLAPLINPEAASQRSGVLSELNMVGGALQLLPKREETRATWSAAAWARERQGWLFISSTPETHPILLPLMSMWLDLLVLRLSSAEPHWAKGHPVWMVIDEVASLHKLPKLEMALTQSRKSNVRMVLGFQGRSQLDHLYGLKAEVMLSQPATKIFLKTTEPRASKWISQCIGDITIERLREGVTAAVHDGRDSMNYWTDRRIEPLVMDSEIAGLEPLNGYLKSDNHVVKIQFSPEPQAPCAEAFLPRAATTLESEAAVMIAVNGFPAPQPKWNAKNSADGERPVGTADQVPPDPPQRDTSFRLWTY